ncbi:hypothetical protein XaraCFBP7407_06130 [Xanthomonas arboricola pv. arracaciae]|uniref:hypothetical protein n=1 Tax=Xanthomonas arboricola TaxID=56448 RepID=UPI000CEDE749|nr:hypothetical protein [Xanthomonas arboricola]PPT97587.1 hypothetical protein XaraCFBP7407_06130 [Xanthomonas arboricola pv. arracaciae]
MTVWTFLLIVLVGSAALIAAGSGYALKLHSAKAAFKANYQRAHFSRATAVALSTERSSIRLKQGRAVKTYGFTDIRAWDKHWHRSKREGTLTVSVRDLDHPVWTLKFGDETEMNKWFELLNQAINDRLVS